MNTISFFKAKGIILSVWAIGSAILILFFTIQNISGRYEGIKNEAWGWFLPNILPTLLLMIGGFFSEIHVDKTKVIEIIKLYYKITLYISIFYFFIITLVLFSYDRQKGNIIEYYSSFNIILSSIQGIVSASIGVFFIKKGQR